jgi:hypothetical protein
MDTRMITMSHEELDRFGVITRVQERRLSQAEAARQLGLGVPGAEVVRSGPSGRCGRPSVARRSW